MTNALKLPNGDIICEGEYGVTRDGQKVGPIVRGPNNGRKYWVSTDLDFTNKYVAAWFACGSYFPNGHPTCNERTMARDIVAKWVAEPALPYGHVKLSDGSIWDMTAERQYPFGMLTGEQQAALRTHGGPWQYYYCSTYCNKWADCAGANFLPLGHYRVTPKPTRVTIVNRDMYLAPNGTIDYAAYCGRKPVTVTYDTIDGVIDYSTYKVDAR